MRLCFVILVAGCSAGPGAHWAHHDGGLQFAYDDLSSSGPADLSSAPPGDLASAGDLAPSGSCAAALASVNWDFESGDQGFTHRAIDGYDGDSRWPFDEWERGTPSGAGPGACHGGTGCWATYVAGNYASCERAELLSPSVDLSACAGTAVKLVFWHAFDFWTGSYGGSTWYDGGVVELSGDGGASWQASGASNGTLAINPQMTLSYSCLTDSGNGLFELDGQSGFVQSSTGWQKVEVAIPAALVTSMFRARFAYSTGVSSMNDTPSTSRPEAAPGWYLDDISISQ